jgi:hypothetical protein
MLNEDITLVTIYMELSIFPKKSQYIWRLFLNSAVVIKILGTNNVKFVHTVV